MRKKKIGLMGGTFDPIHIGHLILGETAYEQYGLDKVYFMPAGNPPHKQHREGRATDRQRIDMVSKAIADNPHFALSLEEMNEDGYSFTYRTLERLRAAHGDCEYYFIIGADSLFDFEQWREPQKICDNCSLVIATRNHAPNEKLDKVIAHLQNKFHGTFLKLDSLNIDISSNTLRTWVEEERTLKYYVPDSVIDYIRENNIYKDCNEHGKCDI